MSLSPFVTTARRHCKRNRQTHVASNCPRQMGKRKKHGMQEMKERGYLGVNDEWGGGGAI